MVYRPSDHFPQTQLDSSRKLTSTHLSNSMPDQSIPGTYTNPQDQHGYIHPQATQEQYQQYYDQNVVDNPNNYYYAQGGQGANAYHQGGYQAEQGYQGENTQYGYAFDSRDEFVGHDQHNRN